MLVVLCLGCTFVLRLAAVVCALRLSKRTGRLWPWLLFAIAFSLGAFFAGFTLYRVLGGAAPPEPVQLFVQISVTGLTLLGVIFLSPFLEELHQAREFLQLSEKKYRELYDQAPDMYYSLDPNGIVMECNETMAATLGYDKKTIIGRPLTEFMTNDSRALFVGSFRDLNTKKMYRNLERDFVRKDGTILPVILNVFGEFDGQDVFVGTKTIARDITERKWVEETLRIKDSAMASAISGIAMTDLKYQLTYANAAFLRMFGYDSEQEVCGRPFAALFKDAEQALAIEKAVQDTGNWIGEKGVLAKDGSQLDIQLAASLVQDGYGHSLCIMVSCIDMSLRKKMQQELFQIEKLESIGVLAGGISHDFNNLLTAILGNISLAKMFARGNDQVTDRLRDAEQASLRARDLAHQLLAFSESGEPMRRRALTSEMLRDYVRFAVRGTTVHCEFSIPEVIAPTEVDMSQFPQVIHHVVANAVQAMPGGGTIQVRCETYIHNGATALPLPKGTYIKISIADQGVGIPAQDLQRIFDPYFSTKNRGSGLGLAMVFSIIKRHDGHVSVESTVGKGTTLHLYLPVCRREGAVI